jgi:hypothetical protein
MAGPTPNVTDWSRARNLSLVSSVQMSFYDDAVEPLAVESAEHFVELVRRAHAPEEGRPAREWRERAEARRPLPRELGS